MVYCSIGKKSLFFFVLFFIFINNSLQEFKTISIPYLGKFEFIVRLKSKVLNKDVQFQIAINSDLTWSHSDQADNKNDFRYNILKKISGRNYTAALLNDSFSINNDEINCPIRQYLVNSNLRFNFGIIGLSYKIINNGNSLLHQLVHNHYINELTFSISPNPSPNSGGMIYFGSLPSIIQKGKNIAKCNVIQAFSQWSCIMKKVYIGDYVYDKQSVVKFSTTTQDMIVPKKFFLIIKEFVLNIDNNIYCKLILNGIQFLCQLNYLNLLEQSISFVIDEYKYTFLLKDLFYCSDNECKSYIISSDSKGDYWEFGNKFLTSYNTSFDMESDAIYFYSYAPFEKVSDGLNTLFGQNEEISMTRYSLIFVLIGLLIIIILVAIYLQFNKLRKRYSYFEEL